MSEAIPEQAEVGPENDEAVPHEEVGTDSRVLTEEQQSNVRGMLNSAIEARDRQWQERIGQQQRQQPAPQAQPQAQPANDIDGKIAALYTDDEVGRRTKEAVDQHFALAMEKSGYDPSANITREEVRHIAGQASGLVRDQIRSGLSVTQEVTDLVNRGVIADADTNMVQAEYSQRMNAAGNNPAAADLTLKAAVYDLIKDNKIQPFAQPRRNHNPLSPGGGAPATPAPAPIDPQSSPFQSVRNMSKDQLKTARAHSKINYENANRG
jgi:hypothetical protein